MNEIDSAPFDVYRDTVREAWIDENDHMNVGYYSVVFDFATDAWLDHVGLDAGHKQSHAVTTFTLESHLMYLRELRVGDPMRFTTQLLDFDEKRIHYIHAMYHAEQDYLASTCELMSLHVSRKTRRNAPMAPEIQAHLANLLDAHSQLPRPEQADRSMGIRRRPR